MLLRDILTLRRVVRRVGFFHWLQFLRWLSCCPLQSTLQEAGLQGHSCTWPTHVRLHREGAHSPAQQMKTNPSWLLQLHQLSATRYLMSWSSPVRGLLCPCPAGRRLCRTKYCQPPVCFCSPHGTLLCFSIQRLHLNPSCLLSDTVVILWGRTNYSRLT